VMLAASVSLVGILIVVLVILLIVFLVRRV
jgi:hypothetical protein